MDEAIIAALRANARASAAAIARTIDAPPSTVKRRIDALVANGVITRFTIDTALPSRAVRAIVEVYCRGNVSVAELRDLIAQLPVVSLAVTVAGTADAVLVVEGESAAAISAMVETLRSSPRVERTRTSLVFDDLLA